MLTIVNGFVILNKWENHRYCFNNVWTLFKTIMFTTGENALGSSYAWNKSIESKKSLI